MGTDAFERALAARRAEKAEEEARKANGGSGSGFVDVPMSALFPNKDRIFRFRGLPFNSREKGTDSKKIWYSFILADNDKKVRIIAPDPKAEKNWILHRIISRVMEYTWDGEAVNDQGKKGKRIYHHAVSHPEIFNRVAKNNSTNPYESGWYFSPAILFNVIDRSAMDWHKENKKLRVLSKKASEGDNNKTWFDLGVPETVYNNIIDDIVAIDGNTNWELYDIAIRKLTDTPWYKVFHCVDDLKKIDESARKLIVNGKLTAEEASWEAWDFDKIYPVSSYKKIFDSLGLFIQKIDKVFNTKYYDELKELVADEEAAKNSARAVEKPVEEEPVAEEEPIVEEKPVAEEKPVEEEEKPARIRKEKPTVDFEALEESGLYKGLEKLTDQEKAWIVGVKDDGKLIFDDVAGELYEDSKTGELVPEKFNTNPYSGRSYS